MTYPLWFVVGGGLGQAPPVTSQPKTGRAEMCVQQRAGASAERCSLEAITL